MNTIPDEDDQRPTYIRFAVHSFHRPQLLGLVSFRPRSRALKVAMGGGRGVSSGMFVETETVVFSRKDSNGRIGKPELVFSNCHVLKTVAHPESRE